MPRVASWIRSKDVPHFARVFAAHPEVEILNAAEKPVDFSLMDGLLLTGGPDVSPQFLHQPVPDPAIIDKDIDPVRDRWEFEATKEALARNLPILGICKGMQLLNVALGGTLHLDIPGHNDPGMKDHDVQKLRTDSSARHRLDRVNSSHHQALARLGEGLQVEAWSADDDVIEQVRMKDYPFALGVQYHPERGGDVYAPLFEDFVSRLKG